MAGWRTKQTRVSAANCSGPPRAEARRPEQPPLSLYIDTGNPGGHHVADWPNVGTAPAYGACNGLLTNSCSFIYGEQRAAHSYRLVAALDPVAAKTAPWWLDVELMASWAGTYQLNVAALQGFIAGLHNAGAKDRSGSIPPAPSGRTSRA